MNALTDTPDLLPLEDKVERQRKVLSDSWNIMRYVINDRAASVRQIALEGRLEISEVDYITHSEN